MTTGPRRALLTLLAALLGLGTVSSLAPQASAADPTPPDHLVVAAVYGGSGGTSTYDWIELYNPTDAPVSLGTVAGTTVTPSYYLCYRGVTASACSSPMALSGTIGAHHYFFVATSGTAGAPANGVTPDLDFTAAGKNPGGKTGPNMGGSTTGGQVLLLNAASNGVATLTGDLSSAAARSAGVVDAVAWTHYQSSADTTYPAGYTQPTSAEVNGATAIIGAQGGTANTNVIARTFTAGAPVDTDQTRLDVAASAATGFSQHSQIGDRVAVAPVSDATLSLGEAMEPIQVKGSKGTDGLTYAATGLPAGLSIDPSSGLISGTPGATDELRAYPVTVTVADHTPTAPETAATSFTLTLSNTLTVEPIATTSVHKGTEIEPLQVTPHGGTPAYRYAATGLPAGLGIDPVSGTITGTPAGAVGRYSVHVVVTDSGAGAAAQSASADFVLIELAKATGPTQGDPLAGLRINEVRATGAAAGDWVELVNTGADVTSGFFNLVNADGETYHAPAGSIPAGAHLVVEGTALAAAGVSLPAAGSLDLTAADDSVLDQTSWSTYPSTSWARYPDGTGDFAVSRQATKGATNSLAAAFATDHLVVAAVYGADGTTFNSDWVDLYNPTDAPISLGTIDDKGTVTPNYYQCYRGNNSNTCSSMKLYGTVQPHHHFVIWNGHNADTSVDAHSKGQPPTGMTPDLDFRYGTNDTNSAATKAANDPSGQVNNGFGGCNTGGQLWLLNAASGGVAPGGDMSSSSARAAGVVDGVGWTASATTQPTGAESAGSATVTGLNSGTNNACVITRRFAAGYAIDTDANSTDFATVQTPSDYTLRSQTGQHVAITPVPDAEISLHEPMTPIAVKAQAIFGDLAFTATGLPAGLAINPSTGVITGTPDAADALKAYAVTVTVNDGVPSDTASVAFSLTLSTVLRLDPIANLSAPEGSALTLHAAAHGGTAPYTYAAAGLPAGLTLNPSTGVISGTPTAPLGRYAAHVTVTDSSAGTAASASRDFTLVELPAVGGPASGDPRAGLRINEVKATGTPSQDWVEIYNSGAAVTGATLILENSDGDTYQVPAQTIAAKGYAVVDGPALAAAGLDLAVDDTLHLAGSDATLLDRTAWTSYAPTSWARVKDGSGAFGVSAFPTKGAANSGAPQIKPNDLLVSEVNYDNNGTDWYEYSEVTNTTDHAIDFAAYDLTLTKSGAPMTLHDSSDTTEKSPVVDPIIPAHSTQIFWWVENNYFGVKTTAQFRANYGIPSSKPVVLVYGFSSMANSGGDHSYYISVNQGGSTLISRSWVDTPCAANTLNGTAVCPATNGNYAEHYALPSDRSNADAAVWYNSLWVGGDSLGHTLKKALSNPGTVDLEQVGFSRAIAITQSDGGAVRLTNTARTTVDLSGYVLEKDRAVADHVLPTGSTLGSGADLIVPASDSGLALGADDWVTLLAPRGYSYTDGAGIVDTTGPFFKALPYDASTGGDPVIDETTGLPLPPAGGLYRPGGISAADGTVYVSNTGDNVLASLANGTSTTVAGSLAGYGDLGDEGPAAKAQLYQPGGTAIDADGNIYIADSGDNVIRVVTKSDGIIHRFAGTGTAGGDGAAVTATSTPTSVNLWHPGGVAVDADDNVFIADTYDNRILKVTSAGAISVVAGTGTAGYTGDGAAATGARLSQPVGVAVDATDNVYIADSSNNVIRRVDAATGVITTVAGDYAAGLAKNGCLGAYAGDGGPATSAQLNDPQGVALDGAGHLFIADTFNHAIREVAPDGTISTLVNTSAAPGAENLSPVANGAYPWSTALNSPVAVAVDRSTNTVYLADTKNNAVAQIVHAARGGNASGPIEPADQVAITGSGTAASACAALMNGPVAVTTAPSISGSPEVGQTLTAHPGTWKPTPDSFTYQWLRDGVAITGATNETYPVTVVDGGHVLTVSVTAVKRDFASAAATSDPVAVAVPALTSATPSVSGAAAVGLTVTAQPGTWQAGGAAVTSFGYQWLRNGAAIAGATGTTYTLTPADYGTGVSVQVAGSYPGYATASVVSAAQRVAAGTLTRAKPWIHGVAKVGRKLTAKSGTWRAGTAGAHLTYQWYVGGKRIAGARKATYTIARKFKHRRISVRVTGTSAGYATVTLASAPTRPVKTK